MLEIRDVYKTFNPGTINEKMALRGVSLKLNDGDFCTVIGGNGAGKSTMLNSIAGTWPVDNGMILIDGQDVSGLPEHKRAPFLGRVFQDPRMGTVADMGIDVDTYLAEAGRARAALEQIKSGAQSISAGLSGSAESGLPDCAVQCYP